MQEVYKRRLDQLQERMNESNVDLVVLFPGPNMFYFSGVRAEPSERHFLLVVPSETDPVFVAPGLMTQEVEESGIDASFWEDSDNPCETLSSVLGQIGVGNRRVLLDDRMYESFSQDIRDIIDAEYGLASEIVKDMRMVKDKEEIDNIREASEIADRVMKDLRSLDPVGMTENELKDWIKDKMNGYGGEGPSFDPVVAAGPNGAKPHHRGNERKIKAEEPVVLDFGCWKNNYPSDQTRTFVFGEEPSEKFEEVFETVLEAQKKAIEAVEPGVKSDRIDEVARNVIGEAGYGDEFIHRTGHGVGLEVHEHPKVPPATGDASELKENMIFSVEPGIYLEEEFGVRIEDLVLVTDEGCERLNKTSRNWKVF